MSDYVATDLIHQLWCQHHEKYGYKFPNEPHKSNKECTFKHKINKNIPINYYDNVRSMNRITSMDPELENEFKTRNIFLGKEIPEGDEEP